jgi:surface carbohydrate biosynthesis protein
MKKKIKVLCFTDDTVGRDVEMMLPIRYFAERFLNCEFHHALNIDIHEIYRQHPDAILQANTIGSNLYFQISKIAHEQNIPIFALISEGNFRTDGSFDYWGFNRDKKFYQEYICCWSDRTAEYLKKEVPEAKDKIVVTGGVGFDRYIIYKYLSKENFLRKYSKTHFSKIIGYAGWAFGKLDHKRGKSELLVWTKGDESKLTWIEEQRKKVRDILKQAIENNPTTLFILKQHPQENSPERTEAVKNEMSELTHYENVLYLCSEESIHDLISVSDLWTCFESTSALESWLMGKQTIFINPEKDFNRDLLYKGSALIQNYNEFQKLIDEFYLTGRIEQFLEEEKAVIRNGLIKNIIGFGDGMNHIRAGYYLQEIINNYFKAGNPRPVDDDQSPIADYQPQYNFHLWHFFVYCLIRIAGPFYNRTLFSKLYKMKKHLWVFENYKMNRLHELYKRYVPFFDEFYSTNNIEVRYKDNSLFKNLF